MPTEAIILLLIVGACYLVLAGSITIKIHDDGQIEVEVDNEAKTQEFLSLSQAAKILGVSESGLRKYVRRGDIQYSQVRKWGPIRFRREWLDAFVSPPPTKRQAKTKLPPRSKDPQFQRWRELLPKTR
jgi:excisionase family DNA binding protein